jgi:serine/threonine protein kinase
MGYKNLSAWSPPEVLMTDRTRGVENTPPRVFKSLNMSDQTDFYPDKRAIDIYSLGVLLWEIETDLIPLEGMNI